MYGRDCWGLWTSVLIIELSTLHSVLLRDTVEREGFVCMYGRDCWGLWTSVLIIELSTLHSVLLRDTVEQEGFANLLLQSI